LPAQDSITARIRQKALELGFSSCGFSPAEPLPLQATNLTAWLRSGEAGEMTYMHRNQDVRTDPRMLLEEAKTIISLTAPYYQNLPQHNPGTPRISRYALGDDYHDVLRKRGLDLLHHIQEAYGPVKGRFFTDSAPILEKAWAERACLGWIGRNGCLITPRFGSWVFLAELIVDIELESDLPPMPNRCGTCTRCVDACPTGALQKNGPLRATRCISYLTIEHKSDFDTETRPWNDWIFGCDICQEVCPWNSHPPISTIPEFMPNANRTNLSASEFLSMTPERFDEIFTGTPLKRTGLNRLKRNLKHIFNTEEDQQNG